MTAIARAVSLRCVLACLGSFSLFSCAVLLLARLRASPMASSFEMELIDDAAEMGFVAIELGEAAALDGEGLPCEGETGGFVGGREVLAEGLYGAVHFEIDGGSTDGGEAFELPLGVGERGDEFEFGDGLGLPLGGEVFEVLECIFLSFRTRGRLRRC